MGVIDPGSSFYDFRNHQQISLPAFTHSLFARAKKRIHFSCNPGYNPAGESISEASQAIRQSDQYRRDIGEVKDQGEQEQDLLRMREAEENEARFEDDVITYVLLLTMEAFSARTHPSSSFPETGLSARAHWLSKRADTTFFAMVFGAATITDQRQEQTRQYYGWAATLEDEFYGRGNAKGQVHHKLHDRFERYFGLTCEAAECAMQGFSPCSKKERGIILSRDARIDSLLEQLTRATTSIEKEQIIKKLKEL